MSGTIHPSADRSAPAQVLATDIDVLGVNTAIVPAPESDSATQYAARERAIMTSNLNLFLHRRRG